MAIAKVFMSGNSQAVRLPKEFRLDAEEVEITRRGDGLLIVPAKPYGVRLVELLSQLDIELPDDPPPEPLPEP